MSTWLDCGNGILVAASLQPNGQWKADEPRMQRFVTHGPTTTRFPPGEKCRLVQMGNAIVTVRDLHDGRCEPVEISERGASAATGELRNVVKDHEKELRRSGATLHLVSDLSDEVTAEMPPDEVDQPRQPPTPVVVPPTEPGGPVRPPTAPPKGR